MSSTSRVIWQEGMFLRAQHFQQQDRWTEAALKARVAALGPHFWGFSELEIDLTELSIGRFRVPRASGVFRDGTVFNFPNGDAEAPLPLELTDKVRNTCVYLAVPSPEAYAVQVGAAGSADDRRLAAIDFDASDTHSGSPEPAKLTVGNLRTRLLLGEENLAGHHYIPVMKVQEVFPDRRVARDERFIPPVLFSRTSAELSGYIADLAGMINQRGEELAARLTGGGTRGVAEHADILLLLNSNRWLPVLRHWAGSGTVHPERLFESFVQMAGELATFAEASARPNVYPLYRHDDLQASFEPVMSDLKRLLSTVLGPGVTEIKLADLQYGYSRGTLTDRTVLENATFYLVVQASMQDEALRRLFPDQVKIGPIEQIRELVRTSVSGIGIRPLPQVPRQLRLIAGANYFVLDRGSPYWAQMRDSAAFGIHVSSEFPNLQMQLWAVQA
jgi:type VI secretion system protein ImpJ